MVGAVVKAESIARIAARSGAASGAPESAPAAAGPPEAGRHALPSDTASASGTNAASGRIMTPPEVGEAGRPDRSAEDGALPVLHAAKLPGLCDHPAKQEDDGGVVDPEDEQHGGADLGVAHAALDGGEVREVESVEPFRRLEQQCGEGGGQERRAPGAADER